MNSAGERRAATPERRHLIVKLPHCYLKYVSAPPSFRGKGIKQGISPLTSTGFRSMTPPCYKSMKPPWEALITNNFIMADGQLFGKAIVGLVLILSNTVLSFGALYYVLWQFCNQGGAKIFTETAARATGSPPLLKTWEDLYFFPTEYYCFWN